MTKQISGLNFLENVQLKTKAKPEEIEVSIFGKGFGECILLNCGGNEYIVIDSFINPTTKNPIVIDYLNCLKEPLSSIKKLVITHWHSDHIAGASDILEQAGDHIKIVLSPVIQHKEFNRFLQYGIAEGQKSTSEFCKIFSFIKKRSGCVNIAGCDKKIFSNEKITPVELFSLSPQDSEVLEYITSLNIESQTKTMLEYLDNNLLSIVILMRYLNQGVLFGGDMENSSDKNRGWDAIVNNYSHTSIHPSLFKVPHHGSINGHNLNVWEKILDELPISFLSTYNKGTKLPQYADIERLLKLSKKVYVVGSKTKRDRNIEQKVRKNRSSTSVEVIPQNIGLVRYRRNISDLNSDYSIESFGAVQEYSLFKEAENESSNICTI